jgi:GR25 family glycosyltransferase involved in LPS biosynthesis
MPPGYNMTKGAVGCALSHREAYLNIQNGDDEYVLIFEDDIELDHKFNEKLLKYMNRIPDYDILYLGYHNGSEITKVNDIYSIPDGIIFGMGAMIINKRAISKLLNIFPLFRQIDSNLQLIYKDLNVYLLSDRIVHSENARSRFGTDIQQ